jgi:hypothetical protein
MSEENRLQTALAAVEAAVAPRPVERPKVTFRDPGSEPPPAPVQELLRERGKTHGDFTEHARITQALKDVMHGSPGWARLDAVKRESLEMNVHKIGRILAGNPAHADHWDDIAGYSLLVSARVQSGT